MSLWDEETGQNCIVMEFIEGGQDTMQVFGGMEYLARPN